jgi:hypothetical protein
MAIEDDQIPDSSVVARTAVQPNNIGTEGIRQVDLRRCLNFTFGISKRALTSLRMYSFTKYNS